MKKIAILLLGLMASLSCARASLVFSETFNYADGPIVANSSGIWVSVSGTAATCFVTNQELIVSARTEDIGHAFGTVYATNGPVAALYSCFTMKCTNLPTAGGTYFAHFSGTNTFGLSGFRDRVWIATTNNTAGTNDTSGHFYLYVVNSLGGTTNGNNQSIQLATNVAYTVVTKYVVATGMSTLWINPNAESDPSVSDLTALPVEDPATTPKDGILNIIYYGFRQASGEGSCLIDDLKIGTAFTDVAGANTVPTISAIPTQTTPASTTTSPIAFSVGDAESAAATLTVTNNSSNPTLVPTSNIVVGGSGANRTLTITPVTGLQGSSTITVYVSDGVNVSSTSFLLKVGAPSVGAVANQITYVNTSAGPITFTVSDTEGDALTFAKGSSNPSLLPTDNVVVTGSGASRTVTLTPAADQTGVSTVSLTVSDGFNSSTTSFVLSVSPKLGVIFSDTFSYTEFAVGLGLYNATGSPWISTSGTNFDLWVTNGAAQLSGNRSEDVAALIASPALATDSGDVLYTSFSVTFSNLPTAAGDYFAHFKDTFGGTTFRAKVYACSANAATGSFRIGLANAANNFSVQFPQDLSLGQPYLVVLRYNTATGESVLWINPNNEGSPSVAAHDITTANSIGAYGLRQSTGIGTLYLDNLIIGTSFSDVATVNPTPTPEPITFTTTAGSLIMSWTQSAFSLASSTNVAGPYVKIPGATSPYTASTTADGAMFFRLVY